MAKMSAEEKKWQAESDANSLKAASEIESDPKRNKAALSLLKKQAEQINKVVKKRVSKKK